MYALIYMLSFNLLSALIGVAYAMLIKPGKLATYVHLSRTKFNRLLTSSSDFRRWYREPSQSASEWIRSPRRKQDFLRFQKPVFVSHGSLIKLGILTTCTCGGIHPGRIEPASPIGWRYTGSTVLCELTKDFHPVFSSSGVAEDSGSWEIVPWSWLPTYSVDFWFANATCDEVYAIGGPLIN